MESKFLNYLFNLLKEGKYQYMVLRNYETLPGSVLGTDIDILIPSIQFRKLREELERGIWSVGYKKSNEYAKNYNIIHMVFSPELVEDICDVVGIDFILDNVMWMGFNLLDVRVLWNNLSTHNNILVLPEPNKTALVILNALLFVGNVKECYVKQYKMLEQKEKRVVDKLLVDSFGGFSSKIIGTLQQGERTSFNLSKIRYSFLRTRGFNVAAIIKGCWIWIKTGFKRIIEPPGFFMVLIGPDGCGKSTVSILIQERCSRLFPGIDHFHLFPKLHLFSFLDHYSRKRWEDRLKKGSEWQRRDQHYPFWKSVLRGFYLLFRFWTGYVLWIYPRLARAHLVLGERWSFDLLFDPASKGIRMPYKMRKILFFLIPKPNRIIVMTGSSAEIIRRKPELPKDEIERQIREIEIALKPTKRTKWVNSTTDVEVTFQEVLTALISA